jgi:hypothetical protein
VVSSTRPGRGTPVPIVYEGGRWTSDPQWTINPLNPELNLICHFLALLGPHHILHVGRIRAKRKEKYLIPADIPSPDRSSRSLVAILTALCSHHKKTIGTVLSILGLQVSKVIGLYEEYDISIHANL